MERHSSTTRHHHNPLWDYICERYRRPGVAEQCLLLQDRWQADVNLLLCCGWIARCTEIPSFQPQARQRQALQAQMTNGAGAVLPWPALLAISANWQVLLRQLRTMRRTLRKDQTDPLRLRHCVLRMELAAERREVDALWPVICEWAHTAGRCGGWTTLQVMMSYARAADIALDQAGGNLTFLADALD